MPQHLTCCRQWRTLWRGWLPTLVWSTSQASRDVCRGISGRIPWAGFVFIILHNSHFKIHHALQSFLSKSQYRTVRSCIHPLWMGRKLPLNWLHYQIIQDPSIECCHCWMANTRESLILDDPSSTTFAQIRVGLTVELRDSPNCSHLTRMLVAFKSRWAILFLRRMRPPPAIRSTMSTARVWKVKRKFNDPLFTMHFFVHRIMKVSMHQLHCQWEANVAVSITQHSHEILGGITLTECSLPSWG